jgi:hypothetical protein
VAHASARLRTAAGRSRHPLSTVRLHGVAAAAHTPYSATRPPLDDRVVRP